MQRAHRRNEDAALARLVPSNSDGWNSHSETGDVLGRETFKFARLTWVPSLQPNRLSRETEFAVAEILPAGAARQFS